MATIGYRRAVAEFGARKLSGSLAWLLWSVVHVFLLIGFRNRVMVMGQEDAGARLTVSRPDRDTSR
jgi:NADH:ubiquinone reductase (H+-translocating)